MARVLLDFEGVDLDGFEPIPPGVYPARIDTSKSELTKSQRSNDSYIYIYFNLEDPEYQGRSVRDLYMVSGKGRFKIGRMLRNLGYKVENAQIQLDTKELHNTPVIIRVTQEINKENGKPYNRVEDVLPRNKTVEASEGAVEAPKSKRGEAISL